MYNDVPSELMNFAILIYIKERERNGIRYFVNSRISHFFLTPDHLRYLSTSSFTTVLTKVGYILQMNGMSNGRKAMKVERRKTSPILQTNRNVLVNFEVPIPE